ncbi:RNA polymerase sigma-70 factor, ECF subfamily [Novosphingobium sp. CF614]|uniref:RNA polymerase sigma factor n=1 Tax=Novosphingobium sp. CF614 TaxID=1884364 RepID=UPI0008ED1F4B|nr:RNA polymerase sigma factor [Novosphingobium sp. CF614]SFG16801.1 RNA polymerase sigma-70 factor, ECF subfamily [Novosphingobium sp. CF614]
MEADPSARNAGLVQVLEDHRGELLRFLSLRCSSADDAQDALQDLWIKASTLTTGPIGNPRAYLFRMANNIVLDKVRGAQRAMRRDRAWIDDESAGHSGSPEDRVDPSEPVEDAIVRRQDAEILRVAIAALPEGAARVLRLYRFDGLGQNEIAQLLGISRSGVEKHLALAMKHLRAALVNCGSFAAVPSHGHGADDGAKPRVEQG